MIWTKELAMTTFHNGLNSRTKLNHMWTHIRYENRLSPTRGSWSWHIKIRCGWHPQDACKCQGTELRVYTYNKNERLISDIKKQYMEIFNESEIEYSIHCSMKNVLSTYQHVVETCSFIFLHSVAMCIIKQAYVQMAKSKAQV